MSDLMNAGDMLWVEATRDIEAEHEAGLLAAASVQAAPLMAMAMAADSVEDFHNRIALMEDSLRATASVVAREGTPDHTFVLAALPAQWFEDWQMAFEARQAEAQRKNARRAFERNQQRAASNLTTTADAWGHQPDGAYRDPSRNPATPPADLYEAAKAHWGGAQARDVTPGKVFRADGFTFAFVKGQDGSWSMEANDGGGAEFRRVDGGGWEARGFYSDDWKKIAASAWLAKNAGGLDGYWQAISASLDAMRKAKSAAEVIEILGAPDRSIGVGDAFFGGDGDDMMGALFDAGWRSVRIDAAYLWCLEAPDGSQISYVEGDVFTGNKLSSKKTAAGAAASYKHFCSLECNREYSSTVAGGGAGHGPNEEPYCLNCGAPTEPLRPQGASTHYVVRQRGTMSGGDSFKTRSEAQARADELNTQHGTSDYIVSEEGKTAARKTAAGENWPRVPHPNPITPGEMIRACPKCGSTNTTRTMIHGPGGRFGDPGGMNVVECKDCGERDMTPAKPMTAAREDYEHWNEDADRMWWEEEGRHGGDSGLWYCDICGTEHAGLCPMEASASGNPWLPKMAYTNADGSPDDHEMSAPCYVCGGATQRVAPGWGDLQMCDACMRARGIDPEADSSAVLKTSSSPYNGQGREVEDYEDQFGPDDAYDAWKDDYDPDEDRFFTEALLHWASDSMLDEYRALPVKIYFAPGANVVYKAVGGPLATGVVLEDPAHMGEESDMVKIQPDGGGYHDFARREDVRQVFTAKKMAAARKKVTAVGPNGFWCRYCGEYQTVRSAADNRAMREHMQKHKDAGHKAWERDEGDSPFPPKNPSQKVASADPENIALARKVLAEGFYAGGEQLDQYTASMIVQIYDALNDENKAKFGNLPLARMVDIGWKLVNKTSAKTADAAFPPKNDLDEQAAQDPAPAAPGAPQEATDPLVDVASAQKGGIIMEPGENGTVNAYTIIDVNDGGDSMLLTVTKNGGEEMQLQVPKTERLQIHQPAASEQPKAEAGPEGGGGESNKEKPPFPPKASAKTAGGDTLEGAIDTALQNLPIKRSVTTPEAMSGYIVVERPAQNANGGHFDSRFMVVDDKPQSGGGAMAPAEWPPEGKIVARIDKDGNVTKIGAKMAVASSNCTGCGADLSGEFTERPAMDGGSLDSETTVMSAQCPSCGEYVQKVASAKTAYDIPFENASDENPTETRIVPAAQSEGKYKVEGKFSDGWKSLMPDVATKEECEEWLRTTTMFGLNKKSNVQPGLLDRVIERAARIIVANPYVEDEGEYGDEKNPFSPENAQRSVDNPSSEPTSPEKDD